ncbi:MAG: M23 family metallopeptidase [Acidimicrobiia bacterium]
MGFPVLGGAVIASEFGAQRAGHKHAGVDIIAPKMAPVVAVADGTVSWVRSEAGGRCCLMGIRHTDGWGSWYIHLNNDTAGTDDGTAVGIVPWLAVGSEVRAGAVIGWVGDSGNAEDTTPHLHFELRTPDGVPVDPMASLLAAQVEPQPDQVGPETEFSGAYLDDDGLAVAPLADLLVSVGIYLPCDPTGVRFCPEAPATGSDLLAALALAGDPDPTLLGSLFLAGRRTGPLPEADGRGCGTARLCLDRAVTRGEAAVVIATAVSGSPTTDPRSALTQLASAGIMDRCPSPGWGDPAALISRAGLLRWLGRALGYLPTLPCGLVS